MDSLVRSGERCSLLLGCTDTKPIRGSESHRYCTVGRFEYAATSSGSSVTTYLPAIVQTFSVYCSSVGYHAAKTQEAACQSRPPSQLRGWMSELLLQKLEKLLTVYALIHLPYKATTSLRLSLSLPSLRLPLSPSPSLSPSLSLSLPSPLSKTR